MILITFFSKGVRSPMNQATSYLDGSQIYGVDVDEQLKLRAGVGGKGHSSYIFFCWNFGIQFNSKTFALSIMAFESHYVLFSS
jgi:hypothetical protein